MSANQISVGTQQQIFEYDLFPPTGVVKIGKDSPINTTVNIPFDPKSIRWGEVIVNIKSIGNLYGRYMITKIEVNQNSFPVNAPGEVADIAVHTDQSQTLVKGDNYISIYIDSPPFGTFFPDTTGTGKIRIQVPGGTTDPATQVANAAVAQTGGAYTLANLQQSTNQAVAAAAPTSIAILAIIAIIIIGIAYVIGKTGVTKKDIPKLPKIRSE